jgi:hypothetical protein
MEIFLEGLAKMDISTIVVVLGGIYFMNKSNKAEMNSLFEKLDAKIDKRCDSLDEKITDVDRRLCRLEGAFASKDCCMIKDSSLNKKIAD